MQEIWKDIPNYEGIYQASNFGNIRTSEGKTTYTLHHGERHWKSRVLKGKGNNYKTGKRVSLWKDGKCKDWLVARLVAITFLGEPKENLTVNHIDGNRMNNRIDNLEWLSVGDNLRHGFENGLFPRNKVTLIKDDIEIQSFCSMSECSKFLDRSHGYVSNCYIKNYQYVFSKQGDKYEYKIEKILPIKKHLVEKEKMKKLKYVAGLLNNNSYGFEPSKSIEDYCKANGIVIVYGHSDDLMEFRGAIDEEIDCYGGTSVFLDENGIIEKCDCNCKYYQKAVEEAEKIEALWCVGNYDWSYETNIAHATFDIYDDGSKYCKGIVFYKLSH